MDQAISIDEFQKKLKRYEGHSPIFYRGQLKRFPDISSSISRDIGYMSNEHNIYQEAIHLKSDEFKKYSTPLEHLAKMQHYEIPTRLIDVTINPLYALFFAVEDVEDESPGLVYIFIQQPKELNSKEIQLLSLLATIEDLQIGHIQHLYEQTFHEQIEHHEILQIVNGSYFVPYTAKLQEANTRLFNQQGTFVICGNLVSEGEIQKDLLTLNSIKPSLIISVPYEYKETIKKELDAAHNINKATVYPELPSVAKYLKEKYKEINLSLDGTYSITEEQDISYPGVRRVSIKITLTKLLKINEIHSAVRYLINEYKGKLMWCQFS